MPELLKHRLQRGEFLVGTMLSLPCPETAEIMKLAGFDWLFLDWEHASFSILDLQRIIQAAGKECPCLIRITANEEVYIKKALDCGAAGVIAPMIKTREDAERLVRYAKYPPLGSRGVGLGRAQGYGLKFKEYVQAANEQTLVVIQIEHIQAVNNIRAITQVAGIDAVMIGPYDLSASMGNMGMVGHPEVVDAIQRVVEECQRCKLPLGIFSLSADDLIHYRKKGFTLIVAGVDSLFMGESAKKFLDLIKA